MRVYLSPPRTDHFKDLYKEIITGGPKREVLSGPGRVRVHPESPIPFN